MKSLLPLLALSALASCATAQAHRLDEYLQATTLRIDAGRVALHVRLVPGVDVAGRVWDAMDLDGDGALSAAERQAYAATVVHDLSLEVDGRAVRLEVVGLSFPTRADIVRGLAQISLRLDATMAAGAGPHRLHFVSRHRPVPSVYLVNTLAPDERTVRIVEQRRSVDQSAYDLDFERR